MKLVVAVICSLCLLLLGVEGRRQRVTVKGRLLCGTSPAANVLVKLWDDDRGPAIDDVMDQGRTNNNGEFELSGEENESTNIDTVFKIYHDCDDSLRPCHRKWKLWIPDKYINGETFNVGTLNLEARMKDEGRKCF